MGPSSSMTSDASKAAPAAGGARKRRGRPRKVAVEGAAQALGIGLTGLPRMRSNGHVAAL
jgi:hypothetical protein